MASRFTLSLYSRVFLPIISLNCGVSFILSTAAFKLPHATHHCTVTPSPAGTCAAGAAVGCAAGSAAVGCAAGCAAVGCCVAGVCAPHAARTVPAAAADPILRNSRRLSLFLVMSATPHRESVGWSDDALIHGVGGRSAAIKRGWRRRPGAFMALR